MCLFVLGVGGENFSSSSSSSSLHDSSHYEATFKYFTCMNGDVYLCVCVLALGLQL